MIIGITGNIGSGKSTFSKILAAMLNWRYIDLDVLAKVTSFRYKDEVIRICKKFGFLSGKYTDYLKSNFFINPELREEVKEFIREKMDLSAFHCQHTIIESAILFEEGINKECDCVIAVICPEIKRFERLEKFRGMSEEAVKERLQFQASEKGYSIDKCDFVIYNDEGEQYLMEQAQELVEKIHLNYSKIL